VSAQTGNTNPKKPGDDANDQLLREGIAAAKMGDKATARTKLRQLVAQDQYSEMGWFWLASVVETDEEKQTCLGNVVVINPQNTRAQQLLNQLSEASLGLSGPVLDVSAPGIRGKLSSRVLLIGGGVLVIAVLLVLLVVSGRSTPPTPTQISEVDTATSVPPGKVVATAAATGPATESPTLALVPPTLPPTWTPSPDTSSAGGVTPLPGPPPNLTGRLVAVHETPNSGVQNSPILLMDPYGANIHEMPPSELGDFALLTPDGLRLIYDFYDASLFAQALRVLNVSGSQAADVPPLWNNQPPLIRVQMMSMARNGLSLVFAGVSPSEGDSPNIYVLPLKLPPAKSIDSVDNTSGTEQANPLGTKSAVPTAAAAATASTGLKAFRLTLQDSGDNIWPALSADGSQVVFVRDTKPSGLDGIDIFIVPAKGGTPKNLTNDALTNVEAAPAFSPDGKRIAFQSIAIGAKTNDIYVMDADGTNRVKITAGAGDNIRPHWSPDGNYLAFSSSRSGKWQIYIADVATQTIYQVTNLQQSILVTDWAVK
jgi:WD40-like Beta Propeller Repeat